MKFKNVGLPMLLFLIIYWIAAIFLIIFLIGTGVALTFYLENGKFNFDWLNESLYALNRAVPGGGILGIGIWLKAKHQHNKDKKNFPK